MRVRVASEANEEVYEGGKAGVDVKEDVREVGSRR